MKEGWKYKKLGEVFETYAGGTPSKTNKANYENGTIPWIRSGEVCRKYITESELFISEEGFKSSSAKYYPVNTVLVAMYGATAAQCGILRFEATSNQAVCGILPHKDFLPEFVYSFFTYFKDELASQAQGGAQPNISQDKIKKILFPCISLSEQQRIVSRLDVAFAHIDELKANAEKQLSEARALFQKALTKAMEPKEGWEEKTLSPSLQDEIQRKTTGAALKQINIKDLRNLQLFVPSLSEQQRIVSRLDSLSAHVRELEEVTQKTIAECDALKQALLRQVFE